MVDRQYYDAGAIDGTEHTHTGDTAWYDLATLTFTPDANKDYIIIGALWIAFSATSDKYGWRLYDETNSVAFLEINSGVKDSTDYIPSCAIGKVAASGSPVSTTIKIQIKTNATNRIVKAKNDIIITIQAGSNDRYTAYTSSESINSDTWTDSSLTDTFTPGTAGYYLVISHSRLLDAYIRLVSDGSDISGEIRCIVSSAVQEGQGFLMAIINLTAASHTIKAQYKSALTGYTAYTYDKRMWIIRLDGFNNYASASSDTEDNETNAAWKDALTCDATGLSASYTKLVLGMCSVRYTNTGYSGFNVLKKGSGDPTSYNLQEPQSTSLKVPHIWMDVDETYENGTWYLKHKTESATYDSYLLSMRIIVIELVAGVTPKQVSDTLAPKLTKVTNLAATLAPVDTLLPKTTGARLIGATIIPADIVLVQLADGTTLGYTVYLADTVLPALARAAALQALLTPGDTLLPALDDARLPITAAIPGADILLPKTTGARLINAQVPVTDTILLQLADGSTISFTQMVSDTLLPKLIGARLINAQVPVADILAPSLADIQTITAYLAAADIVALYLEDIGSLVSTKQAADELKIALGEAYTHILRGYVTLTPYLTDTPILRAAVPVLDEILIQLADGSAMTFTAAVTDILTPSLAEGWSLSLTKEVADILALTLTDNESRLAQLQVSDALALLLAETPGLLASFIAADTLAPSLARTAIREAAQAVSDTLGISLGEVWSTSLTWMVYDTLLPKLTEAASAGYNVQVADTLLPVLARVITLKAYPSVADTILIASNIDYAMSGGAFVSAADTVKIAADEIASISALLAAADTILIAPNIDAGYVGEVIKYASDALAPKLISDGIPWTPITVCEATVRRVLGQVTITYSDPGLNEALVITSSGTAYATDEDHTADAIIGSVYKWFSLQNNVLDGTFHPMSARSTGWWSSTKSDGSGNYSPSVWLQVVMEEVRPVYDLKVYGDDKLGCYPVDFHVKLYDAEDGLLHDEVVTGNTLWNWTHTLDSTIEDVKKMKLEVSKINLASRSLTITEFFTAYKETYESKDLFEIVVYEERDFSGGTLPIGNVSANEIAVKIKNVDRRFSSGNPLSPINQLLKKNRKIEAWLGIETPYGDGNVLWYKQGVFWSQDWIVPENDIYAETIGLDRLERLRNTEFYSSQVYTNYTLADLAELILTDAGLLTSEYTIDSALDSITIPYTWFGRTTHRAALVEIAEACPGTVYCDHEGRIVIKPYADASTARTSLTRSKFYNKDQPLAFTEIVNYVEVIAQPRTLGSLVEIFNDSEDFEIAAGAKVKRFCIYNVSDPCMDIATPEFTQSGADIHIESWTDYTWATEIEFHNSGASAQSVTGITIDGKILAVTGEKRAVAYDEDSIRINGKQALPSPITNAFIQTHARAQAIADSLLSSYKNPRRDVVVTSRGYVDLELGDRINVVTFGDLYPVPYTVTTQTITWDGRLRATIKARLIEE